MIRLDKSSRRLRSESLTVSAAGGIVTQLRPVLGTVQVWVNGDALPIRDYSVGKGGRIAIRPEPAVGDTVRLEYVAVL